MKMRTHNRKRLISMLLTVAMLFTMFPTVAHAEDQELIKFKNMKMAAF